MNAPRGLCLSADLVLRGAIGKQRVHYTSMGGNTNDKPRTNTASKVIMQNGELFGVLHAHRLMVRNPITCSEWVLATFDGELHRDRYCWTRSGWRACSEHVVLRSDPIFHIGPVGRGVPTRARTPPRAPVPS